MKKCGKCKLEKPKNEFYKNKSRYDGLGFYCKQCTRLWKQSVGITKPDGWRLNPEYRKKMRENVKKSKKLYKTKNWRKDYEYQKVHNPEKLYARNQLHYALTCGRLKKQRCQKCKISPKKARIEAHHKDYKKPLTVMWLCYSCHQKEHRQ